ncbi:hypothetical protein ON010_g18529 [Phytophthora cinnamomi]|nr:hypothetical protein ON010_g18529 [Phytophthora cinnamomi]
MPPPLSDSVNKIAAHGTPGDRARVRSRTLQAEEKNGEGSNQSSQPAGSFSGKPKRWLRFDKFLHATSNSYAALREDVDEETKDEEN